MGFPDGTTGEEGRLKEYNECSEWRLHEDNRGVLWKSPRGPAEATYTYQNLKAFASRHRVVEVELKCNVRQSASKLDAAIMSNARETGSHLYWELEDVYDVFRFAHYSGSSDRRVTRTVASWKETMEACCGHKWDHVLLSILGASTNVPWAPTSKQRQPRSSNGAYPSTACRPVRWP